MAKKRAASQGGEGSSKKLGELKGSDTMGVAVISGATFTNKAVTYYEVAGIAIVEGDIAIGTVAEVKQATDAARAAVTADPSVAFSVGITGSRYRWPNCRVPYEIDPALPNKQRVTDAIAHWEAKTSFRFPLRTAADPNWVRFTDAGGCWSMVGMQGGQQRISLGAGCSAGNAIHEIGHTVGLWHEQSREDRDLFVTIKWQNIQNGMAAQFNQHITDGDDLGAYDYGSIMHYPRTAFSKNGQDTITPTDPNAQIGQRTGLSAGDLAGVRAMYPGCGIKPPWREPIKKVLDDRRFKKVIDDNFIVKKLRDPIKGPRDPGPIKFDTIPPVVRPNVTTLPGTLVPFSIATPHHAALAAEMGVPQGVDEGSAAYLAALQQQLLDLEAGIAQARATAAQANADAAHLEEGCGPILAAYSQAMDALGGGGA